MAKGDDRRSRNQIDFQGNQAQNRLNNLWDTITPQNQTFWNNYMNAAETGMKDYQTGMNQFDSFSPLGGYSQGEIDKMNYSPKDIASIRSRAVAPTRALYAGAMRDIDRAKNLGGGYAPNYLAARSRVNRDLSSAISDQSINTEAAIAQLKNQAATQTNQMIGQGRQFGASGRAQMFGTAPGMASMAGNQALNSTGQLQNMGQMQTGLANSIMGNQINASQLAGNWDYNMQRIGQVGNMVLGGISGMQGLGAGGAGAPGVGTPAFTNPSLLRNVNFPVS